MKWKVLKMQLDPDKCTIEVTEKVLFDIADRYSADIYETDEMLIVFIHDKSVVARKDKK